MPTLAVETPSCIEQIDAILSGRFVSSSDLKESAELEIQPNREGLTKLFYVFLLGEIFSEYKGIAREFAPILAKVARRIDLCEVDKAILAILRSDFAGTFTSPQNSQICDDYFDQDLQEGLYNLILLFIRAEKEENSRLLSTAMECGLKFLQTVVNKEKTLLSFLMQQQKFSALELESLTRLLADILANYGADLGGLSESGESSADLFSKPPLYLQLLTRYFESFRFKCVPQFPQLLRPLRMGAVDLLSQGLFSVALAGRGAATGVGAIAKGAYLGVVSMGPHRTPLGRPEAFGVNSFSSSPQNRREIYQEEGDLCYESWSQLTSDDEESWSRDWVWIKAKVAKEGVLLKTRFSLETEDLPAFVLFCRGSYIEIEGEEKILPKTLVRSRFQTKPLHLYNGKAKLVIAPHHEGQAEVIPLGGGDDFWSADFLIAFFPNSSIRSMEIEIY